MWKGRKEEGEKGKQRSRNNVRLLPWKYTTFSLGPRTSDLWLLILTFDYISGTVELQSELHNIFVFTMNFFR